MLNGHHFNLYPSESNIILALVALVRNFSWERISILTQREKPFLQVGYNYVQEQVNNAKHVMSLCFAKVEGMVIRCGAAAAFDIAVKRIDNEQSILNGYELNSMLVDDKVQQKYHACACLDVDLV